MNIRHILQQLLNEGLVLHLESTEKLYDMVLQI
jgi:hypothetical protein